MHMIANRCFKQVYNKSDTFIQCLAIFYLLVLSEVQNNLVRILPRKYI
jgi:hypothetical protein